MEAKIWRVVAMTEAALWLIVMSFSGTVAVMGVLNEWLYWRMMKGARR